MLRALEFIFTSEYHWFAILDRPVHHNNVLSISYKIIPLRTGLVNRYGHRYHGMGTSIMVWA